jgi:hypothetical protein
VSNSKNQRFDAVAAALKTNRLPFAVSRPLSFDSDLSTKGADYSKTIDDSRILKKLKRLVGLTNQIVKEQNERVSRSVENASASERSC